MGDVPEIASLLRTLGDQTLETVTAIGDAQSSEELASRLFALPLPDGEQRAN
jgi:hypothetical protein